MTRTDEQGEGRQRREVGGGRMLMQGLFRRVKHLRWRIPGIVKVSTKETAVSHRRRRLPLHLSSGLGYNCSLAPAAILLATPSDT